MDLKFSGGDIVIEGGDIAKVDGEDAIRQHVECRLRLFKGEYFINANDGVDYFGKVLIRGASTAVVLSLLRNEVRLTPGITDVISINATKFDPVERRLSVSLRALLDTGAPLVFETTVGV